MWAWGKPIEGEFPERYLECLLDPWLKMRRVLVSSKRVEVRATGHKVSGWGPWPKDLGSGGEALGHVSAVLHSILPTPEPVRQHHGQPLHPGRPVRVLLQDVSLVLVVLAASQWLAMLGGLTWVLAL